MLGSSQGSAVTYSGSYNIEEHDAYISGKDTRHSTLFLDPLDQWRCAMGVLLLILYGARTVLFWLVPSVASAIMHQLLSPQAGSAACSPLQ